MIGPNSAPTTSAASDSKRETSKVAEATTPLQPTIVMPTKAAQSPQDTLQWLDTLGPEIQRIKLSTIAKSDNILIVGNKGTGKTTILRTLLSVREDAERIAIDPHDKPEKWGCKTVGGGRNYVQILHALQRIQDAMTARFEQMFKGEIEENAFPRRTLVGDEFRSTHTEIAKIVRLDKSLAGMMLPGDVLLSRASEGRKVGEALCIVAHNDTVEALGIQGNADMKTCFDYIVFMGALIETRAKYHGCPEDYRNAAMALDRPAVVWNPDRNNWYVLDYDILPVLEEPTKTAVRPSDEIDVAAIPQQNQADGDAQQQTDGRTKAEEMARVAKAAGVKRETLREMLSAAKLKISNDRISEIWNEE